MVSQGHRFSFLLKNFITFYFYLHSVYKQSCISLVRFSGDFVIHIEMMKTKIANLSF